MVMIIYHFKWIETVLVEMRPWRLNTIYWELFIIPNPSEYSMVPGTGTGTTEQCQSKRIETNIFYYPSSKTYSLVRYYFWPCFKNLAEFWTIFSITGIIYRGGREYEWFSILFLIHRDSGKNKDRNSQLMNI